MGNVQRFARPMPPPSESASVGSSATSTGRPAFRLACMAAPRSMLTPTTRTFGATPFTAQAMPAMSPPPDSGTTTVSTSGQSSKQLQADRALPRDHVRMIEGRDLDHARFCHEPVDLDLRCVLALPDDAHLGAERADRRELVRRHEARHADDRTDAEPAGGVGDGAAVIARRGADHAAAPLRLAQPRKRMRRAADFERPDGLRRFQLEAHLAAARKRKRRGRHERRAERDAADRFACRLDLRKRDPAS